MKSKSTKHLVLENIILLIPLIIYGIYKNGYLIYRHNLINVIEIFKPLYLILIGVALKFLIDLIWKKKIIIDYNLLYMVLIGMIMPYNINLIVYSLVILGIYLITLLLDKYLRYNKVCLIYLILILVNSFFNPLTFLNILEESITFSFNGIDILMGRAIGGIASSSIIISLIVFSKLSYNIYYKRDIPLSINFTYLLLVFIYFLITHNSSYFINSDLVFGSIFVATLPVSSPYRRVHQIIYGILIGILSFIITILFNSNISIYLAIFLLSFRISKKLSKQ